MVLELRSLIAAGVQHNPDKDALLACGRKSATYKDLLHQIDKTARWLPLRGVKRADRVAVVMPNGAEMASLFLGVSSVSTCAPLNPAYKASEFEVFLSDLKPWLLVIDSALESPARAVARGMNIEIAELRTVEQGEAGAFSFGPDASILVSDAPMGSTKASDVALVLHTSGTTSRLKIVPLTHDNLCAPAANIAQSLALSTADRCLNIMPLFHIHGLVGALLSSLSAGASVVRATG